MTADGRATELDVWLYGVRVATVRPAPRGRGGIEVAWSDDALGRWGVGSRVLSQLLPLGTPTGSHPARVRVWLEGLLPEGRARASMAREHRIDPDDTLAFLAVYGRDTAGAVVLVPAGDPDPATTARTEPIDEAGIAAMLRQAATHGANADRLDSLTSLAGMEPKIALARTTDGWARVRDGAASTHILKLSRPPGTATSDLVDTEAAALDLARRVGLTTVEAHVELFEDQRALVVSRFDRTPGERAAGAVGRLHQEDLAQALGIATTDPDRKFQRGRATPSYADAARVLTDGGATPDALLRLVTFTVVVGNTDAHAKNHAFVRSPDGARASLAPAYDVSMHLHSPASSGRLALDVDGTDEVRSVGADRLVAEGRAWGLPARRATRVVTETLERTVAALEAVDRERHPGVSGAAWAVVDGRARELAAQAVSLGV
ncbi:HipA domain-containing protein [Luteimicrobium sp. NPDC057192]|uniref:HipA domain-containing protein n=1 Tax=Luteimicrobium sp. NPDC057192 TaxID=3346042 RepID=UPI0036278FCC